MATLYQNNVTEFSPELLRNNENLKQLDIYSNYLSDLEVEQLVEFLPNLLVLHFGDNEVSCMRLFEANKFLTSKKITLNYIGSSKIRYYPQETVFNGLKCNTDISWMVSNYRKENSKISQRIEKIDGKISIMDKVNE